MINFILNVSKLVAGGAFCVGTAIGFTTCMVHCQKMRSASRAEELAPYYEAVYQRDIADHRSESVGLCEKWAIIYDSDITDRVCEDDSSLAQYGNDPVVGTHSNGYALRASDL
jgi:hypothetical protein